VKDTNKIERAGSC